VIGYLRAVIQECIGPWGRVWAGVLGLGCLATYASASDLPMFAVGGGAVEDVQPYLSLDDSRPSMHSGVGAGAELVWWFCNAGSVSVSGGWSTSRFAFSAVEAGGEIRDSGWKVDLRCQHWTWSKHGAGVAWGVVGQYGEMRSEIVNAFGGTEGPRSLLRGGGMTVSAMTSSWNSLSLFGVMDATSVWGSAHMPSNASRYAWSGGSVAVNAGARLRISR